MNGKQEIKRVYPPLKMIIVFEILYFIYIYIYTLVFIKVDIQKYIFLLFFFSRETKEKIKRYIYFLYVNLFENECIYLNMYQSAFA